MERLQELAALILRHTPSDGMHSSRLPRVVLIRSSTASIPMPVLYTPSLCLVAQGRKQAVLGGQIYQYDPAKYLVVSMDLPVIGSVLQASREQPYLCLHLQLDLGMLAEMAAKHLPLNDSVRPTAGFAFNDVTPAIADACTRLVELLDTPDDIDALAPLTEREILYRLARGPAAEMLQHIVNNGSTLARVSRVIGWIKAHFTEQFTIKALAAQARMSESALHAHFKAATNMSPLEYRAHLRLQEARRLMVVEGADAAQAGFRVGYFSPSQFSREYRRLFGAAPATDAERIRVRSDATTIDVQ